MYQYLSKRKEIIKRIAVYAAMTLSVITVVAFIIFFMLGFRFDADNGRIEQYAFLQFGSKPSGAVVAIDGNTINSKTPNKTSIPAGLHQFTINRDGYEQWEKTVNVKSGNITWLNYALLVPTKLEVSSVAKYTYVYASLAAPEGRSILIQALADVPSFDLVDLGSDTIKTTKLVIPPSAYSEAGVSGVTHVFKLVKWDDNGRYVLINHSYGSKSEWLVLDTQDASLSKNISALFNIPISSIDFANNGGNAFYVLNQTDIRKLNLSAGTISKPLVSNVTSFSVYNSSIITYVGTDITDINNRVVGVYRDGEEVPHVLRTITDKVSEVHIATTHYYNENYIAISVGKQTDIISGSYPNTTADNLTSMKPFASFNFGTDVLNLSFSPTGEYVLVQSGADFASFDLEYQTRAASSIQGTGNVALLKWLDDNYIWSDRDGNLVISEFDGLNKHTINSVSVGQDVALTHNGKYLYSIDKTVGGYQLQRVMMILP